MKRSNIPPLEAKKYYKNTNIIRILFECRRTRHFPDSAPFPIEYSAPFLRRRCTFPVLDWLLGNTWEQSTLFCSFWKLDLNVLRTFINAKRTRPVMISKTFWEFIKKSPFNVHHHYYSPTCSLVIKYYYPQLFYKLIYLT